MVGWTSPACNLGGSGGDGLDVFLQTETGTLAAPVTYHVPTGGWDSLNAGDLDGDGRTDLVVTSGQGFGFANLNVLLQMPDGTFGTPTPYSVSGVTDVRAAVLADTNGDGRTDIVVSYGGNRPSTFIARFLQNAAGGMDPAVSYPSHDFPTALVAADMDGDGRKDVLVAHQSYRKTPASTASFRPAISCPRSSTRWPTGTSRLLKRWP